MVTISETLKEVRRQLDYREPFSGKPQGHVVLTREMAQAYQRISDNRRNRRRPFNADVYGHL